MPPAFDRPSRVVPALERVLVLALILLGACSFSPSALEPGPGRDAGPPEDGAPPVDADPSAPDADNRPGIPRDVVHVPEDAWLPSDVDLTWAKDVDIDTTFLDISGVGTEGQPEPMFVDSPQDPSGPELAILYVRNWTVAAGVTVRVTGGRPLVVIASGNIELRGVIDAGGDGSEAGPGGSDLITVGPGDGESGDHAEDFLDSGGGGGGHATAGARGSHGCEGDCDSGTRAEGGAGGPVYGDAKVTVLEAGSSGGYGGTGFDLSSCLPGVPGGGGGAVQLYSTGTITVAATGGINAGGGGGGAGLSDDCSDSGAGGGGSGGAVYLQAATIALAGPLAANGGGGGSEGGLDGDGLGGADGALDAVPAPGGTAEAGESAGGAGAAGNSAPQPGADVDSGQNGGGGGGGVGYVVLHCNDFSGAGLVSPTPFRTEGCSLP